MSLRFSEPRREVVAPLNCWCLGVAAAVLAMLALPSIAQAEPPANDNFANALALHGAYTGDLATNVEATKETGELNHAANAGGASLWYSWIPTQSGNVEVDTCDNETTFDTLLAVYTASGPVPPFSNLTPVASSNDVDDSECDPPHSKVEFNATAGTTYYIALDGFNGATGEFDLFLYAPPPSYVGKTNQGKRIRLHISTDGKQIKGLKVGIRYRCRIRGRSRRISDTLRQESSDVLKFRNGQFKKTFRERFRGRVRLNLKLSGRLSDQEFRGKLRSRVSGPGGRCDTGNVGWSARQK